MVAALAGPHATHLKVEPSGEDAPEGRAAGEVGARLHLPLHTVQTMQLHKYISMG